MRAETLPIRGSSMQSVARCVVNLGLKGSGIFWDEEHAEEMSPPRAYDNCHRWKVLEQKAFTIPTPRAL